MKIRFKKFQKDQKDSLIEFSRQKRILKKRRYKRDLARREFSNHTVHIHIDVDSTADCVKLALKQVNKRNIT